MPLQPREPSQQAARHGNDGWEDPRDTVTFPQSADTDGGSWRSIPTHTGNYTRSLSIAAIASSRVEEHAVFVRDLFRRYLEIRGPLPLNG